MKTKKLLFKIALCLTPLWCIMGYIAFFPQNYGYNIIAYNLWHKKICHSKELKKFNHIVLGDSIANSAYVPDYISEDFINLSLPQSTPIENYFVLKEILKIHKPSTIFISFMDGHLKGTMNGLYTERMFSHRFDFITEVKIMNYVRKYKKEIKMIPTRYLHDWLSYRLYLPPVFMPSLLNANFNNRKKDNKNFIRLVKLHRGTFMSRSQTENVDNTRLNKDNYNVSELQKRFYKKILALCEQQNIKVKIVILPLSPIIGYSKDYVKQKNEFYENLKSSFPDIEIVWPFIDLASTDFIENRHMNVHGSFKFSTALRDRYKDIFSSPENSLLSERTISGREDYLRLENEYSTLLERVNDPFYAIVFNPQGNLVTRIKHGDMKIKDLHPYKSDNLFLLNRDKLDDVFLNEKQKYIEFSLGKQKKEIGKKQFADIHIVVINKMTNEIVTEKRFIFKDNSLKALQ